MDTLDAVVLHDPLHRGEPAEELAGHRELQVLIASLDLLGLTREFRVEFRVAALEFFSFVLRSVAGTDLFLVFTLGLRQ